MATELRERALFLLRQALNQLSAEFRDGQWKERSLLHFAIDGGNMGRKSILWIPLLITQARSRSVLT